MQPADQTMITTFLLLRPLTPSRPQVTNTELPAGNAFNLALRAMASRDGFQTQWFGWEDMPPTLSKSTDRCVDTLVWVIGTSAAAIIAMKTLTFTSSRLADYSISTCVSAGRRIKGHARRIGRILRRSGLLISADQRYRWRRSTVIFRCGRVDSWERLEDSELDKQNHRPGLTNTTLSRTGYHSRWGRRSVKWC